MNELDKERGPHFGACHVLLTTRYWSPCLRSRSANGKANKRVERRTVLLRADLASHFRASDHILHLLLNTSS